MGKLFGLASPEITRCRVLELGCAVGLNIIHQAELFPASQFVGIDIAERQIARGRSLISELGLSNIELSARDIHSLSVDEGSFDYIIVHGLYTWADPELQRKVLTLCRTLLSSTGIAFISINALPGWAARGQVRELILRGDSPSAPIHERIQSARTRLAALAAEEPAEDEGPARFYQAQSDALILHELLAPHVTALHLSEFMTQAQEHDLQYLGDSHPPRMKELLLREPTGQPTLARPRWATENENTPLSSPALRGVLLCRAEYQLSTAPQIFGSEPLHLTSSLVFLSAKPNGGAVFATPYGVTVDIEDPLTADLVQHLTSVWPVSLDYAKWKSEACTKNIVLFRSPHWEEDLNHKLLSLLGENLLELHTVPLPCTRGVQERPFVTRTARLEATFQNWITSGRHEVVELDPFEARCVPLLDGTRSHDEITSLMVKMINEVSQVSISPEEVHAHLGQVLQLLAERGVLCDRSLLQPATPATT